MLRFSARSGYRPGAAAPSWTGLVFGLGLALGVAIVAFTAREREVFVPAGAAAMIPADAGARYQAEVLRVIDGHTRSPAVLM